MDGWGNLTTSGSTFFPKTSEIFLKSKPAVAGRSAVELVADDGAVMGCLGTASRELGASTGGVAIPPFPMSPSSSPSSYSSAFPALLGCENEGGGLTFGVDWPEVELCLRGKIPHSFDLALRCSSSCSLTTVLF